MSNTHLPDPVDDLPPSARFAYRELRRADGPLTVQDLVARTGYSVRGIRHATSALQEAGLIVEQFEDADPRRKRFIATGDP